MPLSAMVLEKISKKLATKMSHTNSHFQEK
uniref:Uncharacterized protein n=1 Tax=Arundo donax TaxID=35708 RepID=A0A0A9FZQ2_ARUDO